MGGDPWTNENIVEGLYISAGLGVLWSVLEDILKLRGMVRAKPAATMASS